MPMKGTSDSVKVVTRTDFQQLPSDQLGDFGFAELDRHTAKSGFASLAVGTHAFGRRGAGNR
jgi:hypothetical protein